MLKWLSTYRPNSTSNIITEDPLAIIGSQSKVNEIYAVSRINPLYVDDEYCVGRNDNKKDGYKISVETISLDDEAQKAAEDNFMKRVRYPLNTIPEDRIDATVPRPVWPKDETTQLIDDGFKTDLSAKIHRKAQRQMCLLQDPTFLNSKIDFATNKAVADQETGVNLSDDVDAKDWPERKLKLMINGDVKTETRSSASSSGFSELTASSSAQTLSKVYSSLPRIKQSFLNANVVTGPLIAHSCPKLPKEIFDEKTIHFFQKERMVIKEFPGRPRGDFTLDQDQAEKLIKRLKIRKQQRCICLVVISFLSIVVFILCVVVVSLLITNGKRIFGSL
ncbi:uncharacterized protein LOC112126656 [Cimex lectularius]|uniref:Uncharacterized protein n=1 Tax=Cimex lectularius TaxID=79782 RepID=A0A8I6SSV2_CIMLE|nr:uncharacterized protein LOC112126656 [Cimex lectularius]